MRRYEIAPDIAQSETLPGAFYRDERQWCAQREHLFPKTWHLFSGGDPPRDGEQRPWILLPGCLDEPLLLTAEEQRPRCLSNVCTHRGALLVDEPREGRILRCPYHGRRFALDGTCLTSPGFEEASFPREADHLPSVALARQGPLTFVSLEPALSIDRQLEPVVERTGYLPWRSLVLDEASCPRYRLEAHWALYVDNYLEGLHIPFVHPSLSSALDLEGYRIELFDAVSLQIGEAAPHEPALEPPAGHPDEGRRIAGYYFFLFPCTMINVYPWGLSVNVVLPSSVATTEVQYLTWVWDRSLRQRGAGSALDQVEREDQAIVQRVQRGIGARLYDRGRYAPAQERAVHHFHRLLCDERFQPESTVTPSEARP